MLVVFLPVDCVGVRRAAEIGDLEIEKMYNTVVVLSAFIGRFASISLIYDASML